MVRVVVVAAASGLVTALASVGCGATAASTASADDHRPPLFIGFPALTAGHASPSVPRMSDPCAYEGGDCPLEPGPVLELDFEGRVTTGTRLCPRVCDVDGDCSHDDRMITTCMATAVEGPADHHVADDGCVVVTGAGVLTLTFAPDGDAVTCAYGQVPPPQSFAFTAIPAGDVALALAPVEELTLLREPTVTWNDGARTVGGRNPSPDAHVVAAQPIALGARAVDRGADVPVYVEGPLALVLPAFDTEGVTATPTGAGLSATFTVDDDVVVEVALTQGDVPIATGTLTGVAPERASPALTMEVLTAVTGRPIFARGVGEVAGRRLLGLAVNFEALAGSLALWRPGDRGDAVGVRVCEPLHPGPTSTERAATLVATVGMRAATAAVRWSQRPGTQNDPAGLVCRGPATTLDLLLAPNGLALPTPTPSAPSWPTPDYES